MAPFYSTRITGTSRVGADDNVCEEPHDHESDDTYYYHKNTTTNTWQGDSRIHDGCSTNNLSLDDFMESERISTDRMFSQWDADASGYLDLEEVIDGVKALCCEGAALSQHVDDNMIVSLFHHVDGDRNQVLDKMEFNSLLAAVADQLGLEAEDLVIIARSCSISVVGGQSGKESDNGTEEKSWKLPSCNPFVSLIRKTHKKWVALSKTQRERVSETIRSASLSIDAHLKGSINNGLGLVNGDEEFIDSFDDESETTAMWIPMEVMETTRSSKVQR
jgi:hypothetical protein